MEPIIAIACVALTAAVLIFVFYFDPDPRDVAPHRSRLDQLLEHRDTVYENLRDLKFEHRAGKYSQADYEQMLRGLETEAAMILAEIEKVTGGVARPAPRESRGAPQSS
jgi:hypothetical protein